MKKLNLFIVCTFLLLVHAYSQSFDWAKRVTGSGNIYLNDMVTDASNNVYVVGSFSGTITLGSQNYSALGADIWLAKYSSSGNFVWGKAIPDTGTTPGDDYGYSITLDGNNNVYICGSYSWQKNFNSGGSGGSTPDKTNMRFFAKYTSSGSFQWVKTIETAGFGFQAIAFSQSQNRIYIGGGFSSNNVDFDPNAGQIIRQASNGQAFIAMYTVNGAIDDVRNFGSSSIINDLAIDPAGNVYATGQLAGSAINMNPSGTGTSFNDENGRMFIAKYSSGLGFINASQVSGSSDSDEQGLAVIAPANEEVFYGGRVNGGLYLARRNSSFSLVYEKYYGGSGAVEAITKNGSDLYFTASSAYPGSAISLGNGVTLDPVNSSGDILLAKTNLTGTAIWGATIPISNIPISNGNGRATTIAAVGSNQFILAGHFTGSTDFNACLSSASLSANYTDGFMVKYSGNLWSEGIGPISGPSVVCTSNSTFTLQNLPSGAGVTWTRSSNLTYVSGQGTANYVVKANSSSTSGNGWIKAAISGDCGSMELQKNVWVGTPGGVATDPSGVPAISATVGNYITINATSVPGGSTNNLNWWTNDNTALSLGIGGTSCTVECLKSGYYYVYVSGNNSCGEGIYKQIPFDVSASGGGGECCVYPQLIISPNPADDEVSITFEDTESLEQHFSDEGTLHVLITDLSGNKKYRGALNKNGLKVNLKHLQPGIYIVRISGKDFEQQARLLIE